MSAVDAAPGEHDGGMFVHTHGGAPHAHDAGVGTLLVAAEKADEHADEAGITAPVELSSHVPAADALIVLASVDGATATAEPLAAGPRSLPPPPPLPPPRA